MKQNRTLSLIMIIILCITQSNSLYAHETRTITAKNALLAVKKIVGGSLLVVGSSLTLLGLIQMFNVPSEPSVAGMHQLMVHASLCVGIPSTALGLLIIPFDEESWRE